MLTTRLVTLDTLQLQQLQALIVTVVELLTLSLFLGLASCRKMRHLVAQMLEDSSALDGGIDRRALAGRSPRLQKEALG